ncbi:MAG: 50S ribosomal protein L24 [Planctomycetota bacterium]|jgi:large subunit ribosomal protein L24
MPGKQKPTPPRKFHVKTGDKVIVTSGANRGQTGTIIKVLRDKQRVLLDGDAAVYTVKHVKADPQRQIEGGRVQHQRPIHISNIALLDPSTGKATRVKRDRADDGKVVRVSKSSGHRFEEA